MVVTGRRPSDIPLAGPLPRWHQQHHPSRPSPSTSTSRCSLPSFTTPRRLLRHHPLLALLLTSTTLLLLFPLLRRAYITYTPLRPLSTRRDPHWWVDPWTLPANRFPKVTLYPDVDWNPTPVRFAGSIKELEGREGPWGVRCDEGSHPVRVGEEEKGKAMEGGSPLLYMGIFSTAKKREARDVIRTTMLPRYEGTPEMDSSPRWHPHGNMSIPRSLLSTHFILAYPPRWSHTISMLSSGALTLPLPLPRENANLDDYIPPTPQHPSPSRFAPWPGNGLAWWRKLIWPVVGWTRWEKREARRQVELIRGLAEESRMWKGHGGDLVMLPVEEAMNSGKTYHYFRWVARRFEQGRGEGGEGEGDAAAGKGPQSPPPPPPRFVMKTDDDTFHVLPNLLTALASLSCSMPIYLGTSWGCSQHFPYHFGGLGYALSWPLVSWLGDSSSSSSTPTAKRHPLPWYHTTGNEDARLGSYLVSLRRNEQPVLAVDYSVRMGSYFDDLTFPKDTNTLALHYLKKPDVYRGQAERMWGIWEREGWEWKWEGAGEWVERHRAKKAGA